MHLGLARLPGNEQWAAVMGTLILASSKQATRQILVGQYITFVYEPTVRLPTYHSGLCLKCCCIGVEPVFPEPEE